MRSCIKGPRRSCLRLVLQGNTLLDHLQLCIRDVTEETDKRPSWTVSGNGNLKFCLLTGAQVESAWNSATSELHHGQSWQTNWRGRPVSFLCIWEHSHMVGTCPAPLPSSSLCGGPLHPWRSQSPKYDYPGLTLWPHNIIRWRSTRFSSAPSKWIRQFGARDFIFMIAGFDPINYQDKYSLVASPHQDGISLLIFCHVCFSSMRQPDNHGALSRTLFALKETCRLERQRTSE